MPKKDDKKIVTTNLSHITKDDPDRERRIYDTYMVDTYNDPYDKAMGWYYSLSDVLHTPVRCRCFKERSTSPLKIGEKVKILKMPPEEDCLREMFVLIDWKGRRLAVPLGQLEPLHGDDEAIEIIEDWLYWCLMGYQF